MTEVINTNIPAIDVQKNLSKTQSQVDTALQRLSSGLRINSAKDDAAGLAIATRFTSQIQGFEQASRNANDAISLAQVAEGALDEQSNMLQRIRVLSIQSANGTNSASDRAALQTEVNQLKQELSRIATSTQFNGLNILDGELSNASFQVGTFANQTISVSIQNTQTNNLGVNQVFAANPNGLANALNNQTAKLTQNNVGAQTIDIVGEWGEAAIDVTQGATAEQVATQVNGFSNITGVSANATTTLTLSSLSAVGTVTFDLFGDNTAANPVSISANLTSVSDLTQLMTAINSESGTTGIIAGPGTGNDISMLVLTHSTGANILINKFTHSAADGTTAETISVEGNPGKGGGTAVDLTAGGGATPNDAVLVGGIIEFTSSGSFTLSSSIDGTTSPVPSTGTSLFAGAADSINGSLLQSVATIDISSQEGAQAAISIVDGALDQINTVRATLGAVQSRFTATIDNLANSVENMSAARSRIQDADYAQETTALSRGLILQQAGLQILRQANQLPQNVLTLLQ